LATVSSQWARVIRDMQQTLTVNFNTPPASGPNRASSDDDDSGDEWSSLAQNVDASAADALLRGAPLRGIQSLTVYNLRLPCHDDLLAKVATSVERTLTGVKLSWDLPDFPEDQWPPLAQAQVCGPACSCQVLSGLSPFNCPPQLLDWHRTCKPPTSGLNGWVPPASSRQASLRSLLQWLLGLTRLRQLSLTNAPQVPAQLTMLTRLSSLALVDCGADRADEWKASIDMCC
jgi:hypothetical protein